MARQAVIQQQNEGEDFFGYLGNMARGAGSGIKSVYDFLKPKTMASIAEPQIEGLARSAGQLNPFDENSLIRALARGSRATPEQREAFQKQWGEYGQRMDEIKQAPQVTDPKIAAGVAGETAMYTLPLPIQQKVANIMGPGALSWLFSRMAAGGAPGALYGATRPELDTTKERVESGITGGAIGSILYPLISGAGEATKGLGKKLQKEAQYMFAKQAPALKGSSLREVAKQDDAMKALMKATSANRPEEIAKQAQNVVDDLSSTIHSELKKSNIPVGFNEVEKSLKNEAYKHTQSIVPGKAFSNEVNRLVDLVTSKFKREPAKGRGVQEMFAGNIDDLFQGKLNLQKDMASNGAWQRIANGTATADDRLASNMYRKVGEMIDDKLIEAGLTSVSDLTKYQSYLISAGLPRLDQALRQKIAGTSVFDILIPGYKMLIPYMDMAQTGLIRGVDEAGRGLQQMATTGQGIQQAIQSRVPQSLQNMLTPIMGSIQPGIMQGVINSAVVPQQQMVQSNQIQTPPGTIPVRLRSTGEIGYVSEEEFNPQYYEKL